MIDEFWDAIDAGNFKSYKEEKLYNMGQIDREKEMSRQKKFH
jgi:queuine tRNA-ribosyltransferase